MEKVLNISKKKTSNNLRENLLKAQRIVQNLPNSVEGKELDKLCPLKHSFSDGIYVREIFIPKGTIIIGKIHKHSHPNFLMKGDVSVFTENGGSERLKAPLSMISPPGTKRVVYAHEDTVWITVHITEKTEVDDIEKDIIAKNYKEYEEFNLAVMTDAVEKIENNLNIGGEI